MSGIFLKTGIVLIILGSFISLLSGVSAVVETDFEVEHISSIVNSNVLGFEILEKNGFPLRVNVTGSYSLGVFPKLRIYDQQEQIIFSYLITEFPITTNVYEAGVFTLILEDVTLGADSSLNVTRIMQKEEVIQPFAYLNNLGFAIGVIGSITFIISFFFILTKKKDDSVLDDDFLKAEVFSFMETKSSKFSLKNLFPPMFLPPYVFLGFALFVFPMVFARLNIPNTSNLSIVLSLILSILAMLYSLCYNNILKSRFVNIDCQRLLTLTNIAEHYNIIIVIFAVASIPAFPLAIIFNNFGVLLVAYFTFAAIVIVYIPLFPFSNLLSNKTLAVIFLKKYFEENSSNTKEHNLSSLVKSAEKISNIMESDNIKISSKLLALGLIYSGLQENQKQIKDLLSLLIGYPKEKGKLLLKLKELMTNATELDKTGLSFEFPKLSSERMGQSMKNILTYTALILPIIYYALKVLEVI
jgi:hypothetical protein